MAIPHMIHLVQLIQALAMGLYIYKGVLYEYADLRSRSVLASGHILSGIGIQKHVAMQNGLRDKDSFESRQQGSSSHIFHPKLLSKGVPSSVNAMCINGAVVGRSMKAWGADMSRLLGVTRDRQAG